MMARIMLGVFEAAYTPVIILYICELNVALSSPSF